MKLIGIIACVFCNVFGAIEAPFNQPSDLDELLAAFGQHEEAGQLFENDDFDNELPGFEEEGFNTQALLDFQKNSQAVDPKLACDFQDYMQKYYPKAFVISLEYLLSIRLDNLAEALGQINTTFTQRPWFYYVDDPKKFKLTRFWESIVDQLAIIHEFFVRARVDVAAGKIVLPYNDFFPKAFSSVRYTEVSRCPFVIDYLLEQGSIEAQDFFALCFDYELKLFNEGVLIKNIKQAQRYMSELEYLEENLRSTRHAQKYDEALKTAKQLLELLRAEVGPTNDQLDSYRERNHGAL